MNRETLRRYEFFEGLADADLDRLAPFLVTRCHGVGEAVAEQGGASSDLLLLDEGSVAVLKERDGREHTFREVSAPAILGEMAFLEGGIRSTTLRCTTPTRILHLERGALEKADLALRLEMSNRIARTAIDRLRAGDHETIDRLETQNQFGRFVILLIICLCLIIFFAGFGREMRRYIPYTWITFVVYTSVFGLSLQMMRTTGLPLSSFGVHLDNWRRSLAEGALLSFVLIALFALVFPDQATLARVSARLWQVSVVLYVVVAIVQEFLYRGILQSTLQRFYGDDQGTISVLFASVIYGLSHVHYGALLTVGTLLLGIPLGFLYLRHRSLIGVTIVHFVVGMQASMLGLLIDS